MPKYHKKVKGIDAHQHVAGEDWTKAEQWVQDLIAAGRLVIGDTVTIPYSDGVVITVYPTDWIVLESGAVLYMTDAVFQDTYEQQGQPLRGTAQPARRRTR